MAEISVGIDIGSSYTKVVEIEQKTKPCLLNAFMFKSPFLSTAQETLPKQIDADFLWKQIFDYIPLSRLKKSGVGINIPARSIATLLLLLPRMKSSEIAQAAIVEARRKMIPASGPEHIFEWLFIGEMIVAKIPRHEIVAVRAENFYVQALMGLFKGIDAVPSLISPPCSLLAHIIGSEAGDKGSDTALIDLGYSDLGISVYKTGKFVFTRTLAFGLGDIVKDISRKLGMPGELAEKVIEEEGVPEVGFDVKDKVAISEEIMRQKYEADIKNQEANQKAQVNPLELRIAWQAHLDRIIHELRRSLAYYKEQSAGRRIEHIYFLGGGSQVKNLFGLLSKHVGGSWHTPSPFKNIQLLKTQTPQEPADAPAYANAVSLALAALAKGKKADTINFLPADLKKKGAPAGCRFALLAAAACLVGAFVLINVNLSIDGYALRASLRQTELELNKTRNNIAALKGLSQLESAARQRAGQVAAILKQRRDFYPLLKELAQTIPRKILITKIDIYKFSSAAAGATAAGFASVGAAATPPPLAADTGQEEYRFSLTAQVFADYEEACAIIENLKASLASLRRLANIEITPLALEEISLEETAKTDRALRLTQPKERNFALTAEVVKQ